MIKKVLLLVEPAIRIDANSLKVYLVDDNEEAVQAACKDCDTSMMLLNMSHDILNELTRGTILTPWMTYGILFDAASIFDNPEDVAVVAVDYHSSVPLPEFKAFPDMVLEEEVQSAARILNSADTKIDLADVGRLITSAYSENQDKQIDALCLNADCAYRDIVDEKPYYSTKGGYYAPRGVYYRLLMSHRDYSDLATEEQSFVRLM